MRTQDVNKASTTKKSALLKPVPASIKSNSSTKTRSSTKKRVSEAPATTTNINVRWFKEQIALNGLSQRKIAKEMNLNQSVISHMFKGRRRMSLEEAVGWAKILKVPLGDVVLNAGIGVGIQEISEIDHSRVLMKNDEGAVIAQPQVPIRGFADANFKVIWTPPVKGPTNAPNPLKGELGLNLSCIRCQTIGGAFEGLDGAMLYFRDVPQGAFDPECVGRLSLVQVGSEHLIRIVKRGYAPGRHNLALFNGILAEESVVISSATPIIWMKL